MPSGDRLIARLLMKALEAAGHEVCLASILRSRDGAGNGARQRRIRELGSRLAERFLRQIDASGRALPECWFTYHLYHKAPDWIGPRVADALGLPYVVAEASVAPKQAGGAWDLGYRSSLEALRRADTVIALNSSDLPGLRATLDPATPLVHLPPFVDDSSSDGSSPALSAPVDPARRGNDGNYFSSFSRKRESAAAIAEVPSASVGTDPPAIDGSYGSSSATSALVDPVRRGLVDPARRGSDGNYFSSFPRKRESTAAIAEVPSASVGTDPLATAGVRRVQSRREEIASEYVLPADEPWLVAVAMMRAGNKEDSYRFLARALRCLLHRPWRIFLIGDGPRRGAVERAFGEVPSPRIRFVGALAHSAVAPIVVACDLFVWPALDEPLGMAMLEAQALGVPVVSTPTRGVADVVQDGVTGLLVADPSPARFAGAVDALLEDQVRRRGLAETARRRVAERHSLRTASKQLDLHLRAAAALRAERNRRAGFQEVPR